jgi:maltose O-acetyltransferase
MPLTTEKKKLLAGESYNCLDPELQTERQRAKRLLRLFNLSDAATEGQAIVQRLPGQMGHKSVIEAPF